MRLFVRHTKDGTIVSLVKANVLPEGLEHPYVDVGDEEAVLEIESPSELEDVDAHEIAERFRVDVQGKKLTSLKKTAPAGGSRRRRKGT
jgi:hypothetical protein